MDDQFLKYEEPSTKICFCCKEIKSLSEFGKNKNSKDGLQYVCKGCLKKREMLKIKQRENVSIPSIKVCKKCNIEKPIDEFFIDNHTIDKHKTTCKECEMKRRKEQVLIKQNNNSIPKTKICISCYKKKSIDEFGIDNGRIDKHSLYCKECCALKKKQKKSVLEKNRISVSTKVCFRCKIEKPSNEFRKDSYSIDGISYVCQQCVRETEKEKELLLGEVFVLKNRARAKKWADEHPDENRRRANNYYYANKPTIREKALIYEKEKYHNDPNFNIVSKLRRLFNGTIKGRIKSAPTLVILGCDLAKFRRHFENAFKEGMSWDLYLKGKIECDHIIPRVYFNMDNLEEQRICFNHRNLQPLWAKENHSKHNSLDLKSTIDVPWGDPILSLEERKSLLRKAIDKNLNYPYYPLLSIQPCAA